MLQWRRRDAQPFVADLMRFVDLRRSVVVDLGCGEGGFSLALAEHGARRVLACDVIVDTLARGHRQLVGRRVPVTFFAQDGGHMALPDAGVDVVFTIATFEHFPDPEAVLAESFRVLRPGGLLYASFETYYGGSGGHYFDLIGLPWIHLLFPERHLLQAWQHLAAAHPDLAALNFTMVRTPGGLERRWLNRISLRGFDRLVAASSFERVEWRVRLIKNLQRRRVASLIPSALREVLATNVTAVLRRPSASKG